MHIGKTIDISHIVIPSGMIYADWCVIPERWGAPWAYGYLSTYVVLAGGNDFGVSSSRLLVPGTYWEDEEWRSLNEAIAIIRAMPGAKTKK